MRFLLAGLLILILPAAAMAQAKGEVLTVGYNNYYRPDCWTPMLVQLTSQSDQSTVYQIQVAQEDLDHDRVVYTQTVTLGGNVEGKPPTTENFWVYFRPKPTNRGLPDANDLSANLNTLNAQLKVFLCDKNGKQISTLPLTATIQSVDPYREMLDSHRSRKLVLIVTDGLDKANFPDYSTMRGVLEDVDAVAVQPRDLPNDIKGYEAIDVIVWMDADATFLTTGTRSPAMDAIRTWVHQGGHLVVCQPADAFKVKPFKDMLPVGGNLLGEWAIPMVDRKDVDILNRLAHPNGDGKPWPEITGRFKVARVPALKDTKVEEWMEWTDETGTTYSPWLARRGVGLGAVTWVAQDLGNPALTEKARGGWRYIWDRIFDWNNPNTVAENYQPLDPSNDPWHESQMEDLGLPSVQNLDLSNEAALKIFLAFVAFIVYFLVAGPGMYLFLRTRKRPELNWFAFGLSAVIATGLTILLVKAAVRGPPQLHHLSIVRYGEGEPYAVINSRFGLYIPQDGREQIQLDKTAERQMSYITPFGLHPVFVGDDDSGAAYLEYEIPVRDPSDTDAPLVDIPYRSTSKKLQTLWVGAPPGRIEVPQGKPEIKLIEPTRTGGYIDGTLVNHCGYDLEDVYIAFKEPFGFETGIVSTRDRDWLIRLPKWPKDGTLDFQEIMKPENLINLDRDGSHKPLGDSVAFGDLSSDLTWDRFWKANYDKMTTDLSFDLPLLTLFERLSPWKANINSAGPDKKRGEFYRHNARELDLSAALSAGQLVIVGTESINNTLDTSPLPVPLTVSGDPVTGHGRTIVEFVLPLDKSAVYQPPATRPAATMPATMPSAPSPSTLGEGWGEGFFSSLALREMMTTQVAHTYGSSRDEVLHARCEFNRSMIFGNVARADHGRLLEYGGSPPLRKPLAGPMGIGSPFRCEDKTDSPPAAAIAKEFRAQVRPQPSQGSRRLSDLPGIKEDSSSVVFACSFAEPFSHNTGGRTRRAVLRRLRSARGRNSLTLAAAGGDSSPRFAAKGSNEPYRGSQRLPQRPRHPIYEPATVIGTNDTIENNPLHPLHPNLPNAFEGISKGTSWLL